MRKLSALLPFFCLLSRPVLAETGFAEPPLEPQPSPRLEPDEGPTVGRFEQPEDDVPASTLRVAVGPALRVDGDAADGGLAATLDVGARAVGARASGTWVRVGSERGLSQYGVELWIDFGAERRLHPIVGAGAAVARVSRASESGAVAASSYGVGVLRGSLEYVLPVEHADARAGIDAVASVPAIQSRNAPDANPWVLFIARVGIGF